MRLDGDAHKDKQAVNMNWFQEGEGDEKKEGKEEDEEGELNKVSQLKCSFCKKKQATQRRNAGRQKQWAKGRETRLRGSPRVKTEEEEEKGNGELDPKEVATRVEVTTSRATVRSWARVTINKCSLYALSRRSPSAIGMRNSVRIQPTTSTAPVTTFISRPVPGVHAPRGWQRSVTRERACL